MTDEIWEKIIIDGQETIYKISNKGNIKNTKTDKIFKNHVHKQKGYVRSTLHVNDKIKVVSNHRLVMNAFKPMEGSEKYDVHHKDGIKTNNRLENLEWIEKREHILMEMRKGTIRAGKTKTESITFKGYIGQFNKEGILQDIFAGKEEIEKVAKYNTDVYKCVLNATSTVKGMVYRRFPKEIKPEIGKKYDLFDDMFTQFFRYRLSKIPSKNVIQLQLPL